MGQTSIRNHKFILIQTFQNFTTVQRPGKKPIVAMWIRKRIFGEEFSEATVMLSRKPILMINSHASKKLTLHVSSWLKPTIEIKSGEPSRNWVNLTCWRDSSYQKTTIPVINFLLPVTISVGDGFENSTSGLSGYDQKFGNLIYRGVPWNISGIWPR